VPDFRPEIPKARFVVVLTLLATLTMLPTWVMFRAGTQRLDMPLGAAPVQPFLLPVADAPLVPVPVAQRQSVVDSHRRDPHKKVKPAKAGQGQSQGQSRGQLNALRARS